MKINTLILKYNDEEFKETGLFDYGWRQYMPDLGKWNGMDQLSEMYASTSPFAYVANNPVSMRDPDGRWMDANGHIDTSGNSNPFRDMAQSQMRMTQFMGRNPGEGGAGGNYLAFGNTQAYTDLMTAFFNKGEVGISNHGGALRWWTSMPDSYDEEGNLVKGVGALGMLKFKGDTTTDWYGPPGKVNWFIGAAGTGIDTFANRFYIGTARPNAPVNFLGSKFYGNGRTFIKAAPIAKAIGRFSFGLAVAMDGYAWYNGEISGEKFTFNTAMGAYGLTPVGAIPAMMYFGVDAFYPGGWTGNAEHPGAIKDTERRQSQFDSIINTNSGMPRQYIFPYGSQKF